MNEPAPEITQLRGSGFALTLMEAIENHGTHGSITLGKPCNC